MYYSPTCSTYALRQAQGERRKVLPIAVTGNNPNPFRLSRRWRRLCEADSPSPYL